MKRATVEQRHLIVDILSKAFLTNPSVNYVVRQDAHHEERIRKLMDYASKLCERFGQVWVTEDKKGCALVLLPDTKRTTWQTIRWDVELALSCIGLSHVRAVMKREAKIKMFHPRTPFAYLWFIGVYPDDQMSGIGSVLLEEVIGYCERRNRPIYLETSVQSNLGWYRKFGFEVYHTIDLGYTLHLLRRN